MALIVLVTVEDDEAALSLVEWIEAGGGEKVPDVRTMKVPSIYKMPTMFHRPFESHAGKMANTFTLGQKWGWWVCSTCKKPSSLVWETLLTKQTSFGKNIKSMFFTEETTE
jgi:hypothetical protein